ncbi:MAG: hypothetical protein J7M26_09950, partial [Armatimonadetes bacterium]|nr:hypothetical protein [Armatimonadota bacterium]
HLRGERVLVQRCRRGDADGLDALVYRLAGPLWQAAVAAGAKEEEVRQAVVEGFDAAMAGLRGWHEPALSALEARAVAVATARAREASGVRRPRTGRARTGDAQEPAAAGELTVPGAIVEELRARARAAAPELYEAAQRRGFWLLQAYAVLLALIAGVVMILVNYGSSQRWQAVPPAVMEGVQFRVRHTGLSSVLRDVAWELPDPDGADKASAAVLEEAALALDEVANVSPRERVEQFRYLAWRVRQQDLSSKLEEVAQHLGPARRQVEDAALVLEEVSNWFGG